MKYLLGPFFISILLISLVSCNKSDNDTDSCGSLGCWTTVILEEASGSVYDIIYDGSEWIAVGYKEVSGVNQPALWYSADMNTWTSVNITTVTANSSAYTVIYDGYRWVVGGGDHSISGSEEALIWYTTSLSGTWQENVFDNNGGGGSAVTGLYYDSSGSLYAAAGHIGHGAGQAILWHVSNDPTGAWTSVQLAAAGGASSIARRSSDNMWLVGGQVDGTPPTGAVWVLQSDFSAPVQLPVSTTVESSVSAVAESAAEGKDAAVGYMVSGSDTFAYLWHSDSGTGNWTEMNFTAEQWAREVDIAYNGTHWIAVTKNVIWYADSIAGTWTENETNGSVDCNTVAYSSTNSIWMIGGSHNDSDYPVILYLSGQ